MDSKDILADIRRIMDSLPPNPVAPENRGFARLQPSAFVPRGAVYRLSAQPDLTGSDKPLIVMNQKDVEILREQLAGPMPRSIARIDQDIADFAEQMCAEQEARGR